MNNMCLKSLGLIMILQEGGEYFVSEFLLVN